MEWSSWFQIILALFGGAWLYSTGARHVSVLPGEDLIKRFGEALATRISGNNKKQSPPIIPRVTS